MRQTHSGDVQLKTRTEVDKNTAHDLFRAQVGHLCRQLRKFICVYMEDDRSPLTAWQAVTGGSFLVQYGTFPWSTRKAAEVPPVVNKPKFSGIHQNLSFSACHATSATKAE